MAQFRSSEITTDLPIALPFDQPRTVLIPIGFSTPNCLRGSEMLIPELQYLGRKSMLHSAIEEAAIAGMKNAIYVTHSDLSGIHNYVRNAFPERDVRASLYGNADDGFLECMNGLSNHSSFLFLDGPQNIDLFLRHALSSISEPSVAVLCPTIALLRDRQRQTNGLRFVVEAYEQTGYSVFGLTAADWESALHNSWFEISQEPSGPHAVSKICTEPLGPHSQESCLISSGRAVIDTQLIELLQETQAEHSTLDYFTLVKTAFENRFSVGATTHETCTQYECSNHSEYVGALNDIFGVSVKPTLNELPADPGEDENNIFRHVFASNRR